MHKTIILKKFIFLALITSIYYLITSPIYAQSVLPLTVGPARQQILVNPGEQAAFTIKFYNQSESPIAGTIKVADFLVQDKDGSPRIIDDITQASPKFSGSQWVTLPYDRMSIPASDKVTMQATLSVPKDARPGGRYISVYFEPAVALPQAVGDDNVGQGIAPRIASLLYIRVAGPILESAMISNLFAQGFYEYGPIKVTSEILNRGDYHIRPRGVMSLIDPWGGVSEQTTLKEANIFPDAARSYENTVGTKWMLGRYKINLAASYGEKGQALERSIYIWVFPWKVAAVAMLTLIMIVVFLKGIYKRIILKEASLETQIEEEKEEIEKLKEELKKRKE